MKEKKGWKIFEQICLLHTLYTSLKKIFGVHIYNVLKVHCTQISRVYVCNKIRSKPLKYL